MTTQKSRTGIEFPEMAQFYSHMQDIRREAEIERSIYLSKLVSMAAAKVRRAFHDMGELFAFTQRMNEKVRL